MRKDPLNLDASTPSARPFDASQTLSPNAQQAICQAQELARALGSEGVESVHLLLGALQIEPPDEQLRALLQISGLKADEVRLYAQAALAQQAATSNEPLKLGESARRTLQFAGKEARRSNCALVDISHIFAACFRPQNATGLAEVLAPLGTSANQLSLHLRQLTRGETAKAIQNESPLAQLTAHGERALDAAHANMRANFCGRISTLHLLTGVLENPDGDAVAALKTLMIDVEELRQRVGVAAVSDGEIAGPNRLFTPAAKRALDRAKAAAREGGRTHIGSADLLMGLLPQPTLLIERAQFGARPDDPAAAVLREVDADLVRAIFNPRGAATPPARTKPALNLPAFSLWPAFLIFALQVLLALSLERPSSPAFGRSAHDEALINAICAIMFVTLLLMVGMVIFAKNPARKMAYAVAFVGAIAGSAVGLLVAG